MVFIIITLVFLFFLLKILARILKRASKQKYASLASSHVASHDQPHFTVGFFHPFCYSGGGGERVLWSAVKILQDTYPKCVCVIYTGDSNASHGDFVKQARERFSIQLSERRTQFVYLKTRWLLLAQYYPAFTLLGQSLGSMVVGLEAFLKFIPDVYFETTGYAFTYPLFHYLGN